MSFVEQLTQAIIDIKPDISDEDLKKLISSFSVIIVQDYPQREFTYIGNGSFKEAYLHSSVQGLVIKFIRPNEYIENEQAVYYKAQERGLGNFFVPSVWVDLPTSLTSEYLYDDDEDCYIYDDDEHDWVENPDYEPLILTTLMLQPYILEAHNDFSIKIDDFKELNDEEKKRLEIMVDRTDCIWSWVLNAYNYYGKEELFKFFEFCEEYEVRDLRRPNLGYIGDKPVILDWLS